MKRKSLKYAFRPGFSFLELQVAFVLLAIALAGLGPLVVMQSRQLKTLESRFSDQTTHYLVPPEDAWAAKLGAPAAVETEDPGSATPPVTLIDDGDPGYSETDAGTIDWQSESEGQAFQSACRSNNGGNAGDKAHWVFTGLEPGWYEVLVTYPTEGNHASNAPYSVYDDAAFEATVPVDQRAQPSGAEFEGSPWESLGAFSIVSGTLRVDLGDSADGNIMADAVRIAPTGNDVQLLSLDKQFSDEEAVAKVSVTVQVP